MKSVKLPNVFFVKIINMNHITSVILILSCSGYIHRSLSKSCAVDFDSVRCIIRASCINYIEDIYIDHNDQYFHCSHDTGIYFFPLEIVYNSKLLETDKVPEIRGSYRRYNHGSTDIRSKISSFELSNNGLLFLPKLESMTNLVKLNLSHNSLISAELSLENEYPLLVEVDYSYNNINTIEIHDGKYVFMKLKKLILSHNNLVSITTLENFNDLEVLDLSHNFITFLNPMTFEGIKKIYYLNLSDNRISDINTSLFRFRELLELDLSRNKIENIMVRDFENIVNVRKFKLNSNLIINIEDMALSNMTFLEFFDLSNNKIESFNKNLFVNLESLNKINLSYNKIKSLPKNAFKGKNLTYFSIKNNILDGAIQRGMFEGLKLVTDLDLSYQHITSIEDFAFFGLEKVNILLLNNNEIEILSKKSFKILQNLEKLDISGNKLMMIDFDKEDLLSLRSLSLQNNYLSYLSYESLHGMSVLQVLDVSNNNISQIAPKSFESLRELINFEISNNPLSGILAMRTFAGLNSLPSLDISQTYLNEISNNSFSGMTQVKKVNISNGKIEKIQFNSFIHTGVIETLDISHNRLREFYVNCSEIIHLSTLLLHHNLIKTISASLFQGLPNLLNIVLSHNQIEIIDDEAFQSQEILRHLDLSYNPKLKFNLFFINNSLSLLNLYISGIPANMSFTHTTDFMILELEMSWSGITNITKINVKELKQLNRLVLSNNEIAIVENGAFNNISYLKDLDLSYNKIEFIQPGVFTDNTYLESLNISHNLLIRIGYGVFRGLIYLQTLDISFNKIDNLKSERFYETPGLTALIADHNRINYVDAEDFSGTSLSKLSIGDNPLPCEILVNFKRTRVRFEVTAIKLVEGDVENFYGVTCNREDSVITHMVPSKSSKTETNDVLLMDIRNILLNISNSHIHKDSSSTPNIEHSYSNISNYMKQIGNDNIKQMGHLFNLTKAMAVENNNTNSLLERILRVLSLAKTSTRTLPIPKDNGTNQEVILYLNKVKQNLEDNMAIDKHNFMLEVDKKIALIKSHVESLMTTMSPSISAKYESKEVQTVKFPTFTEICVAIILLILVLFVLYKFYESRTSLLSQRSTSTRQIVHSMESSNL